MVPQKNTPSRWGISMRRYCAEHEAIIQKALAEGRKTAHLQERHLRKLAQLQHERLVHLIVLVLAAVVFLFSVGLLIALPCLPALIFSAISLLLLVGYLRHYFFLENTVQRWYVLADGLEAQERQL